MFASNLTAEDKKIIKDELNVLDAVKIELKDQVSAISENKLGEASAVKIGTAETKDEWSALYEQLNTYNALALQKGKRPLPDPRCPYFAHFVLEEENQTRDILIGYGSLVGTRAFKPIVDWRTAPVAELFFQVKEGEQFRQVLPKRIAEGLVSIRRVVNIKNSELISIDTPLIRYQINDKGVWEKADLNRLGLLEGGEGKAIRSIDIRLGGQKIDQPELISLLDKDQFNALNEPADQSLLILGGAGSGKTTVALYRLAKLISQGLRKDAVLVIVPNSGLVNLCRNILSSMNLQKVQVNTYDNWISAIGWKTFRGLPKKLCQVTPDEVIRVKRHSRFFEVLESFLEDQFQKYHQYLLKIYPTYSEKIRAITWDKTQPFVDWMDRVFSELVELLPGKSKAAVGKTFSKIRKEMLDFNEARVHLYTDDRYLALIGEIDGDFNEYLLEKFKKHSREQFFERYGKMDIDKDTGRHLSLDGFDETEFDDSQIYKTIDVEDFPILYYLLYRITGRNVLPGKDSPAYYEHIVLDEAQELSLLEVKTLGRLLNENGSVTIAGDAVQHTSSENSFKSWEEVLSWMNISDASRHRLTTNYRSTKPIADLGTYVLGDLAKFVPEAKKEGKSVAYDAFAGYGQAMVALSDVVKNIIDSEPDASLAIICRSDSNAKNIFSTIEHLDEAKLVLDGSFDFQPGVDVTTVEQVKGLEFDYVVIPDADSHVYKDDPYSRRLMHVSVTRAVYQLWVFSTATPSIIIRHYDFDKFS